MNKIFYRLKQHLRQLSAILLLGFIAGCGNVVQNEPSKPQLLATSNIVGDVVGQIAGNQLDLTVLLPVGKDPHSFEPTPADLVRISEAEIIFVNGFGFETFIEKILENAGTETPIITVSDGIIPRTLAEAEEHDHDSEIDPHVWLNPANIHIWVENIETALTEFDPENGDIYAQNAQSYLTELDKLTQYAEEQFATIPPARRILVTNHDSLGYLADAYQFTVIGAIIPANSTAAEPSAGNLAQLITEMQNHQLCALFTETTVSDQLAQTVAGELDSCETVQLIPLYTGSIGVAGSGAESYIGMFQANVDQIVTGLR